MEYELFFYFGKNPFILSLRDKVMLGISGKTHPISTFATVLSQDRRTPKVIYCNKSQYSALQDIITNYNNGLKNEGKKPKYLCLRHNPHVGDGFGLMYEDTQSGALDEFETEFLQKNLKYPGLKLGFKLGVWGENVTLLQERFSTTKEMTEVTVDQLMGITQDLYQFKFKETYFFLKKDCCENPFTKRYSGESIDIEGLNRRCQWPEWVENGYQLKPHQIDGIRFLKYSKRGCIFDSTGVGKTIQAICAAIEDKCRKILIITIANDKVKWERNCHWWGLTTTLIEGNESGTKSAKILQWRADAPNTALQGYCKQWKKKPNVLETISTTLGIDIPQESHWDLVLKIKKDGDSHMHTLQWVDKVENTRWDTSADVTIINYDVLPSVKEKSVLWDGFDCVIVDECHKVKEANTIQSKTINKICNASARVYGLSATPIENNENMFNVLRNLGISIDTVIPMAKTPYSDSASMFDSFIKRYCAGWEMTKGGKKILIRGFERNGEKILNTNTAELANIIRSTYIRRTETDIEGFPQKTVFPLYVNLDGEGMKEYQAIIDGVAADPAYTDGVESLMENMRLRQFMSKKAIPTTCGFVKSIVDSGNRCVVFTHFMEEFDEMKMQFEALGVKCLWVNANSQKSWKKKDNFEIVDEFNSNMEYQVLFGNIETLGTAHNIPSANYCVVNSPDWANRNHTQGEGRIWRLNRVGDVFIVYPIFKGTIVETIFDRAEGKKSNFNILFA